MSNIPDSVETEKRDWVFISLIFVTCLAMGTDFFYRIFLTIIFGAGFNIFQEFSTYDLFIRIGFALTITIPFILKEFRKSSFLVLYAILWTILIMRFGPYFFFAFIGPIYKMLPHLLFFVCIYLIDKLDKKYKRIILVVIFSLVILFYIFSAVSNVVKASNLEDFEEELSVAIANLDYSFCFEQDFDKFYKYDRDIQRSNCFGEINLVLNNISLCEEDKYGGNGCFTRIALLTSNVSLCEKIMGETGITNSPNSNCFKQLAINTSNEDLCNRIELVESRRGERNNFDSRVECFTEIAKIKEDYKICYEIPDKKGLVEKEEVMAYQCIEEVFGCYDRYASDTDTIACHQGTAEATKDYNFCRIIHQVGDDKALASNTAADCYESLGELSIAEVIRKNI